VIEALQHRRRSRGGRPDKSIANPSISVTTMVGGARGRDG
jgi:hypothetical protein